MKRVLTDKEISERLKTLTIIADTREQVNGHVTQYFDANKVPCVSRKLDVGDYSAMISNLSLEDEVVIERKANIDEIAGNFTTDRERFEREFLRAKACGIKVFLIIENASWEKIASHDYRSRVLPKALIASLLAWQTRFGITVIFCKPESTGKLLYGILYYWAKERLEYG